MSLRNFWLFLCCIKVYITLHNHNTISVCDVQPRYNIGLRCPTTIQHRSALYHHDTTSVCVVQPRHNIGLRCTTTIQHTNLRCTAMTQRRLVPYNHATTYSLHSTTMNYVQPALYNHDTKYSLHRTTLTLRTACTVQPWHCVQPALYNHDTAYSLHCTTMTLRTTWTVQPLNDNQCSSSFRSVELYAPRCVKSCWLFSTYMNVYVTYIDVYAAYTRSASGSNLVDSVHYRVAIWLFPFSTE